MSLYLFRSIAQIGSVDGKKWGTGFVFYQDEASTYFLTCAHIIGDAAEALVEDQRAAVLVFGHPSFDDVAVLKAPRMADMRPLRLRLDGSEGDTFVLTGCAAFGTTRKIQPLTGHLDEAIELAPPGRPERVSGWNVVIDGVYPLEGGYSGSPIVHRDTTSVIGIATHSQGNGSQGTAISLACLMSLWGDSPTLQSAFPQLLWESLLCRSIAWYDTFELKEILSKVVLSDEEIQHLFLQTIPTPVPLPENYSLPQLIDWLAMKVGTSPGETPLVEFVLRCREVTSNPRIKDALRMWCSEVAKRSGFELQTLEDRIAKGHQKPHKQSIVMIKVEPALPSFTEYLVRAWFFRCGDAPECIALDVPEERYAVETLPGVILDVMSRGRLYQEDLAVPPHVEIILPLDLLNIDIDHWDIKLGKTIRRPVGTRYPLAVRSWERLYDPDYIETWAEWHQSWNRCPAPAEGVTDNHVHWSCSESDNSESLYDHLQSVCIFLALTLQPHADTGNHPVDTLSILLDSGTAIAVWLRRTPTDTASARAQLRHLVYEGALESLPSRIRVWREQHGAPAENESFPFTLLWDDPKRLPPDTRSRLRPPD